MKTILVDAGSTFVIKGQGVFQPMFELLEKYPNRKIILTNANDEEIVSSGQTGLPYELFTLKHKPDKVDPGYFEQMLKHFNLRPEDVIYFDHIPRAVKSAQSVGITSYYYDPDKKDLRALRSFLNENITPKEEKS